VLAEKLTENELTQVNVAKKAIKMDEGIVPYSVHGSYCLVQCTW